MSIFTAKREEDAPPLSRRLLELARELDERILGELTDAECDRWVGLLGKKYDWVDEEDSGSAGE